MFQGALWEQIRQMIPGLRQSGVIVNVLTHDETVSMISVVEDQMVGFPNLLEKPS